MKNILTRREIEEILKEKFNLSNITWSKDHNIAALIEIEAKTKDDGDKNMFKRTTATYTVPDTYQCPEDILKITWA